MWFTTVAKKSWCLLRPHILQRIIFPLLSSFDHISSLPATDRFGQSVYCFLYFLQIITNLQTYFPPVLRYHRCRVQVPRREAGVWWLSPDLWTRSLGRVLVAALVILLRCSPCPPWCARTVVLAPASQQSVWIFLERITADLVAKCVSFASRWKNCFLIDVCIVPILWPWAPQPLRGTSWASSVPHSPHLDT